MTEGRRVLFAGLSRSTDDSIDPVGMIVMTDRLRNSAAETVSYFYRMGIDVKIISGDSPVAAAAAAKQCGVRGAERFTDVSTLSASQLKDTAHTCSIFGRATPETKRDIVAALQACGHKVTMIWDGVNDLLAMRRADCSAAVLSGSDAARTTAELVLPDSDFSALCDVISKGRRTVCNLTRCAGIFFIKTIYSVLICIMCLIMNFEFPFTPIQITLIDAMIEALPALAMSFEFSIYKPEADPIRYALRAALPNSLVILMFCAAITLAALHLGIDKTQEQLLQYPTVGIISIAGVVRANMEHTPGADHRRISHRIRMFRNTSLPAARLSAYYRRKRIPAAVRPYRRCSACRPHR